MAANAYEFVGAQICIRYIDNEIGFGVFAAADFEFGELIETCLALPFPNDAVGDDILSDHRLEWSETHDCMGTGYAMLYNHADNPNCLMVRVPGELAGDFPPPHRPDALLVVAHRRIMRGEQLLIKYKCTPWW